MPLVCNAKGLREESLRNFILVIDEVCYSNQECNS